MNVDTIMKEQADAILKRIRHETIEVTMTKTKLKFRIDDRPPLPTEWKRALLNLGDPFIMVNTLTGEEILRRDVHANSTEDAI